MMQDSFDKKREMIKTLMGMLKKHASDEVTNGMSKPKPQMTDLGKPNEAVMQPASDSSKMAEGGLAGTDMSASDEPNRVLEAPDDASGDNDALALLPEAPQEEQGEAEERQTLANENMEHEDEDNNQSAFSAFLSRKKKK